MEGKEGKAPASNSLHGACAKRKRSWKLPVLTRAATSSKRAKCDTGRTISTDCSSNEVFSRVHEDEGDCSENESSSVPKSSSRFLYYEKGEWLDFSGDIGILLSESLRAGKSVAEVFCWGCMHLVNFVLMMQINRTTGFTRSIAWIDDKGKCFFPSLPFEGWSSCHTDFLNCVQQAKTSEKERRSSTTEEGLPEVKERQIECPQSNEEMDSDAESVVSCHPPFIKEPSSEVPKSCMSLPPVVEACKYPRVGDKLVQLDDGDLRYALIKNKFLEGLGILGRNASVKAIYHDSHTTPSSKARLLAFQRQMEVTKQTRGNPNVHYAWHGTSKEGVCGIVLHGFGQPMRPNNGAAFGIGVYLAPENYSHVSAIYSDYDENGEQHAVLCKVILGNTELVPYGSAQYHPSSEDYDTGVDNLLKPKRYVVWSTHMNTNILPLYVVNFKLSTEWRDLLLALRGKHVMSAHSTPNANNFCIDQICSSLKVAPNTKSGTQDKPQSISFPLLLSILKSKLPETDILLLRKHYLMYKAQRISRVQLSDAFRRVVGDEKLSHAIMLMKKQVGSAKHMQVNRSDWETRGPVPSCEASEVCYTSQALT